MSFKGFLVDVDYCTGCEACVLACQQEKGYSEKEFGLKIQKLGPLKIAEKDYQYDFIPLFTKWCDLCADRVAKGKQPACAQHCQSRSLEFGDIEKLSARIFREKQFVVALKED
ncbi:MAG: 4Fe-4S binding protein [Coriobacteriaceae bacterium]|jgi:anaerobic dimethyl sulfoxide reductase subunit B (iron-sulfur subunit)|nr:4Fe-4S binding protein [Coriobacteriaceae bacterium]